MDARALLDSGSQINLITEQCAQRMRIPTRGCNLLVNGIGSKTNVRLTGTACISILSGADPTFKLSCEMCVISKISSCLPVNNLPQEQMAEMSELTLADPKFNKPGRVEMLLGAQVWAEIIKRNIKRFNSGLTAQDTHLGWIVFGLQQANRERASRAMLAATESPDFQLSELLRKFWEIEELSKPVMMSPDDQWVEDNFRNTHYRNSSGRYVVTIPLKAQEQSLGSTRAAAIKRFLQLERKLGADAELKKKYVGFMREYQELGHMTPVEQSRRARGHSYHIPHHCVTKKFRVVFDASCQSDSGISLNDIQLPGARLQDDLSAIITRFRCFKVAITADIKKMFRQVCIDPEQWDLQTIFWREDPNEELQEFWLTVVTYGMTSSGFNAVRAMHQCADDQKTTHPLAHEAISSNFYMDDMLTGADTEEQAVTVGKEIVSSLGGGGFELDKFMSSSERVLAELGKERCSQTELSFPEDYATSILGLVWDSLTDHIMFKVRLDEVKLCLTKRAVISAIAKLYDPNGYLAPVIVTAKIFIQDLWRSGVQWDEEIPASMVPIWKQFYAQLTNLSSVRVPRWLGCEKVSEMQLHGFADASTRAYAAVVYLRTTSSDGATKCVLITSKTRVAPLKTVSVPRLELCAAELLARLMAQVVKACRFDHLRRTYWSDSTAVLYWISKLPFELKTFVANRVSSIQELTSHHSWKHVASVDNPADMGSRRATAAQLIESSLWWEGPGWLKSSVQNWPKTQTAMNAQQRAGAVAEQKPAFVGKLTGVRAAELEIDDISLLERKSAYQSMLRVTALVMRFVRNVREHKRMVQTGPVTPSEQEDALIYWVKITQQKVYHQELDHISRNQPMDSSSNLITLVPFVDSKGILRVGGRLQDSSLPYQSTHPIILPARSKLSELLLREAHLKTLHGGVQLCMQYIRQKFWIPTLRRALKTSIGRCIICFRQRQKVAEQLMGSLPKDRVQQARAFRHSGIDYAGPFQIKARGGRCKVIEKGYVAVFVCMVTRAIHLELVSSQTSEAFLAAFQRFTGRRGGCSVLWSDNATTFVGADRELRRMAEGWRSKLPVEQISAMGTEWKRIVPGAPHVGGIWEAGVKSAKHHLRRVMGKNIFTFEMMSTTLILIEACLNSRPLSALSDDPGDLCALTPGHFLIGEPIVQPLMPDISEVPQAHLKLWSRIYQMQQHFWRRWSEEYIISLQQRFKWNQKRENVRKGDLVLIKQENMPPTVWPLGRIIAIHHGRDGLVRSAEIKLEQTTLVRPVQKLCILPNQEPSESN